MAITSIPYIEGEPKSPPKGWPAEQTLSNYADPANYSWRVDDLAHCEAAMSRYNGDDGAAKAKYKAEPGAWELVGHRIVARLNKLSEHTYALRDGTIENVDEEAGESVEGALAAREAEAVINAANVASRNILYLRVYKANWVGNTLEPDRKGQVMTADDVWDNSARTLDAFKAGSVAAYINGEGKIVFDWNHANPSLRPGVPAEWAPVELCYVWVDDHDPLRPEWWIGVKGAPAVLARATGVSVEGWGEFEDVDTTGLTVIQAA